MCRDHVHSIWQLLSSRLKQHRLRDISRRTTETRVQDPFLIHVVYFSARMRSQVRSRENTGRRRQVYKYTGGTRLERKIET